LPWNMPLEGFR